MRVLRTYGFIATFFALCLLPLASTATRVTIVQPVDENRKLAAPPAWSWPPDPTAITQQAERWYGDHFGLRSLLIRLKTQVDLSVFRTSDRVHVGSDGWLFYRSVMDVEKPSIEALLAKSEGDILAGINAFGAALRAKGIHLIIVQNLLADRFVPEKLPTSVPRLPSPPRYDHFMERLASLSEISYLDSSATLRRLQQDRPIFHKTDFHWNDPAAFEVARELVEMIARLGRRTEPVWTHKLEIDTKPMSGWIARFMPVFSLPSEAALFVKPTWQHAPGYAPASNEGAFEYVARVLTPNRALLPPTVVYGDSFFDGIMRSGFEVYFQTLYRARVKHGLKLSGIAGSLPADTRYLVIQFIEVTNAMLLAFADKADLALATQMIRSRP
jgi:hypothetical protein